MTRRRAGWLAVVVVLGAVDLAATIHAHLDFHRTATGPAVMPLSQLLGWITSVMLLAVAIALCVAAVRRGRAHRRTEAQARHEEWPDIRPTRIEAQD